jgi:hypothetical protein
MDPVCQEILVSTPEPAPEPPKIYRSYHLLIGLSEDKPEIYAFIREEELPDNLDFLRVASVPKKAALVIRPDQTLCDVVSDLLAKAQLSEGSIEVLPLRTFDEVDREQFRLLKKIPGFSSGLTGTQRKVDLSGIDFA